MAKFTLYEMATQFVRIADMIEEADEVDAEAVAALDALELDLFAKVGSTIQYRRHIDDEIECLEREEKRLKAKRERAQAKRDWLTNYVNACMEIAGVDRINWRKSEDGIDLTVTRLKGPKHVELVGGEKEALKLLPAEFTRTKTEADKLAIRAALDAGKEVPGAILADGKPQIRVK